MSQCRKVTPGQTSKGHRGKRAWLNKPDKLPDGLHFLARQKRQQKKGNQSEKAKMSGLGKIRLLIYQFEKHLSPDPGLNKVC